MIGCQVEVFRDGLPGQSLWEEVDLLQLLWISGVHDHETVEVPITHMTGNGTWRHNSWPISIHLWRQLAISYLKLHLSSYYVVINAKMFPPSVAKFFALSLANGLALLWQIINGLPLNINPEVSTIKMLICFWWGNGKQTVQLNVGKTREQVVDFWRCLHSSPQKQTSITNPPTQLALCCELTCEPVRNHVLLCFHDDLGKARQRNAHICRVGLCNTHRRHVSWAKWYRYDEQSDFVQHKPGTVKPSGENHSSSRKVCDVTWKGRKSGNNNCVLSFIEQQLWGARCL